MSRRVQTACPLDCPDACSLVVETDAGATTTAGALVSLGGDTRNRLTADFICGKVRNIGRHLGCDERLSTPLIREGGVLREASWDEALELIATRLLAIRDQHGGEAILPFSYGGSNGALSEGCLDARMFRRLGASELERTVCAAATGRAHEGLYGTMPGVDICDYDHANLIVVWGFNPSASGIHLVPIVKRAQARGAKVVVIDPRATPLTKTATAHLAVRPGTDVVLALAIARWLFAHAHADLGFLEQHTTRWQEFRQRAEPWTLERAAKETGLDTASIEAFARMYAEASVAVIRCGWGLERNRNGGSAVAAVLALPAVAGKFGVRGGGFTMSQSRTFPWDTEVAVAEPPAEVRSLNMNRLGPLLLGEHPATRPANHPIHALFVYNANPLATIPDQVRVREGLRRDDLFVVVYDQVQTDTADFADVVLPATTFLEHHDLTRSYGSTALHRIVPALPRHDQARPNYEVFAELIERMGLAKPGDVTDPEALRDAIEATIELDDEARARLRSHGTLDVPSPGLPFVDRGARTPDGKVHFVPPALDAEAIAEAGAPLYSYRPDPGSSAFPLALISPASAKTISSTFAQLIRQPAVVDVHPSDAQARGIADGTPVRLFNALGAVECLARVGTTVRPGVVSLPKGLWARHTDNGNTASALCPTTLTDIGHGATFNDARVQLEARATPGDSERSTPRLGAI